MFAARADSSTAIANRSTVVDERIESPFLVLDTRPTSNECSNAGRKLRDALARVVRTLHDP